MSELVLNIDPISLEPIEKDDEIVINENGHDMFISAKSLIENIVISGNTKNPLTRKELSIDILKELEIRRSKNTSIIKITNNNVKPFDDKRNGFIEIDHFSFIGDVIISIVRWASMVEKIDKCDISYSDANELKSIFDIDPSLLYKDIFKNSTNELFFSTRETPKKLPDMFIDFLSKHSRYEQIHFLNRRLDENNPFTGMNLIEILNVRDRMIQNYIRSLTDRPRIFLSATPYVDSNIQFNVDFDSDNDAEMSSVD